MSEQISYPQTLTDPDQLAAIPLDVLAEIGEVETQFVGALEDLELSQMERLENVESGESGETENDLPFRGTTVLRVGGEALGLAMMPRELARDIVTHEVVETMDDGDTEAAAKVINLDVYRNHKSEEEDMPQTIYRENGNAYAQDQLDLMKWAPQAEKIIDALIRGDDSLLGALPPEYAENFRVWIKPFKNGVPDEEREKMISVACNGLADKHGELPPVAGSPEAKAQDEAWEREQEQKRAA